jgi:O-antigen ligase
MTTLSAPQTDVSLLRRASYVLVAKNAVKENPFIGTGPGTFPLIYQYSTFASAFAEDSSGYARSAHNTYLEVVVGTGILGLGVFFIIIIWAFIHLYRIHKHLKNDDVIQAALVRSIAWSLVAFLTALMFSSQLYHKYIWLLLGLSFVVDHIPVVTTSKDEIASP